MPRNAAFDYAEEFYDGYHEPVPLGDEAITFLASGSLSTVVRTGDTTIWVNVPPDGAGDGVALAELALDEVQG